MHLAQTSGSGLESVAPSLVLLLGLVIVVAFVTSAASSVYAQQRVASTIEIGVQGIVGANTVSEVSRATDSNTQTSSSQQSSSSQQTTEDAVADEGITKEELLEARNADTDES